MVAFINAKRERLSYPLSSDLENTNPSLFKRLRYAKDMLIQMINPAQSTTRATASDFCKSNNIATNGQISNNMKSATMGNGFGGTGGAGTAGGILAAALKT